MGEPDTAATVGTLRAHDVVVRPRPTLLRSTALSVVVSAVPLAVALVWVSFPLRLWAIVATAALAAALIAAVVLIRFRIAYVRVGATRIDLRGVLLRSMSVDRAAVGRIIVATTYGWTMDRTAPDLIALSPSGDHLFRMRGVLWDEAAIGQVASALDVQVTELAKPMPLRELHRMFPSSRTWYQRLLRV